MRAIIFIEKDDEGFFIFKSRNCVDSSGEKAIEDYTVYSRKYGSDEEKIKDIKEGVSKFIEYAFKTV